MRYEQARQAGNVDVAAVIIGEAVDMVRAVEPADTIVRRIAAEAERALAGGVRLLHHGA